MIGWGVFALALCAAVSGGVAVLAWRLPGGSGWLWRNAVRIVGASLVLAAGLAVCVAMIVWPDDRAMAAPQHWGAVAALLLAAYAVISPAALRVILRAVLVYVPVGMIGYAVYLALPQDFMSGVEGARIKQALVAGSVVAVGWVVTFAVQELRAEQQRQFQMRELMVALAAEISDVLVDLSPDAIDRDGKDVAADILRGAGHAPYVPFVPRPKSTPVIESLSDRLHILPRGPLYKVVAYATQARDVQNMALDLQRADYASLPETRRAKVYERYSAMRRRAFQLGVEAVEELDRALPFWVRVKVRLRDNETDSTKSPGDRAETEQKNREAPLGVSS